MLLYLNNRVANCAARCVICDDELGYEGIRPVCCEKALCEHSLYEYGLGIDIYSELVHNEKVVDLLMSLTCATAYKYAHF